MNAYLSFFRFLIRFSLSEAIFLSTFPLSTLVSFFASWSKAFQPFGFLVIAVISCHQNFAAVGSNAASAHELIECGAHALRNRDQFDSVEVLFPRHLDPARLPRCVRLDRNVHADVALSPPFHAPGLLEKDLRRVSATPFAFDHLSDPHKARVVLLSENAVGKSLADGAAHCGLKPTSVVARAGVESERLLGRVALQVERGDRDVSPLERTLQQRPEVLQAVRVDRPFDVLAGMVDCGVQVRQAKLPVAGGRVGEDLCPVADVAPDGGQHRVSVVDRDHLAADLRRERNYQNENQRGE